jgi:tetratricopeptide (TPR) repeat protein
MPLDAQCQSCCTTATMRAHQEESLASSRRRPLSRLALVCALSVAVIGSGLAAPEAFAAKKDTKEKASKMKTDPRELQAREAFAAGRYQEALDIYAKLYAENLHPTFLRNIGRCHQNMGNPDEAILSFRDYLRKAPEVPPNERQEVEGFIGEMQNLKERQKQDQARQQQNAQTTVLPPPGGQMAGNGQTTTRPAGVNLRASDTTPPEEQSKPVYKKAWFWVAAGVVVAGLAVGGLWAGGAFKGSSNCRAGYNCQ